MPTYVYRCAQCDAGLETVMSIREYTAHPPVFVHCGKHMERAFTPPQLGMVSERHYDGLRAPDGADISSRAKHREYMRRNNLTTVDDFKVQWQRDAKARSERVAGMDPQRAHDVARAIEKLGG